jgi:hypothetical protein
LFWWGGNNIGVCISRFWNKKFSWRASLVLDLIIENYSIYTWRHYVQIEILFSLFKTLFEIHIWMVMCNGPMLFSMIPLFVF